MEEFEVVEDCLYVKMPEEVDHHQANYLSKNIDYYICNQGVNHIVFDFCHTKFMDSSGIGIIVGRYKKISCFHGKLYATHLNKQIDRILNMVSLRSIIEIVEDDCVPQMSKP